MTPSSKDDDRRGIDRVRNGQGKSPGAGGRPSPAGGFSSHGEFFPRSDSGVALYFCALVLVLAVAAIYGRTLSVPALYDDLPSIVNNESIRSWPTSLRPPDYTTTSGRPVLNISFALNFWISGTDLRSYHAVNIGIHALAALALFGTARRLLARTGAKWALAKAFSIALLWAVHPLQTEAVTYTVQRAESLVGLFYLLTLYAFVRMHDARGWQKGFWTLCCVAASFLGMGTKEVMASAPIAVFLLDRAFFSGSCAQAFRQHGRLYSALASGWLVLGACILSSHGRSGTAAFGFGAETFRYLLYQTRAVAHYLWLCAWPRSLLFDYGTSVPPPDPEAIPFALLALAGVIGTFWLLARRPALGFLAAWFLLILAPTSTVVIIVTEPVAEHRMYLALVPVVTVAVWAVFRFLGRAGLPVCLAMAIALGLASASRNRVYGSALTLWSDAVSKRPDNERARVMLGEAWFELPGHVAEAIREFSTAVRLAPDDSKAHNNLGNAFLTQPGRLGDALSEFKEAVRLDPGYAQAHNNLGNAYTSLPNSAEDAVREYRTAVRLKPNYPAAYNNLGNALSSLPGHLEEAIASYREALHLNPALESAHFNLGNAYLRSEKYTEAIEQYEAALALSPTSADAHFRLALALVKSPNRRADAIAHLETALRLKPGFEPATNLLWALGVDKP
ncbi:MAG TPA: tetratricopeptide repeat protein [Opitutaceae bacterium]|jgi:tetratricopeptide (TPR) repeat protein